MKLFGNLNERGENEEGDSYCEDCGNDIDECSCGFKTDEEDELEPGQDSEDE